MQVLSLLSALLTEHAFAQEPPAVVCTGLAGCGGAIDNVLFTGALPVLIGILGNVAGAAAVIFIAVAGVQMMLAFGDESKITSSRWAVVYALIGLMVAMTSQVVVAFVVTEDYGQAATQNFLFGAALPSVIRILVTLFNVVFVLTIMFAGYRMTIAGGKGDEYKKCLGIIRWSLTGAVITNASHALVNALLAMDF